MKKLMVASFISLIIPLTSHAAINPGVEFLTPLVQTIIGLLQDRISVLVGENNALRAQVASCQTLGSQAVPEVTQPSQPSQPVVSQPTAPTPVPQTVSVSYVYRTDAPYVAPGNIQDRCPTFTFASDKTIFVEKLVFSTTDGSFNIYGAPKLVVLGSDVKSVSSKIKTFRACFGDVYVSNLPSFNVTLLGSETLIYGSDGTRIQVGDVSFTY